MAVLSKRLGGSFILLGQYENRNSNSATMFFFDGRVIKLLTTFGQGWRTYFLHLPIYSSSVYSVTVGWFREEHGEAGTSLSDTCRRSPYCLGSISIVGVGQCACPSVNFRSPTYILHRGGMKYAAGSVILLSLLDLEIYQNLY